MGELIVKIIIVVLVCDILFFAVLYMSHRTDNQPEDTDAMPHFPSCDWDLSFEMKLVFISANTAGSIREKQEAVIEALQCVWYGGFTIDEYIEQNIKDTDIQPKLEDFTAVDLVKRGEWGE